MLWLCGLTCYLVSRYPKSEWPVSSVKTYKATLITAVCILSRHRRFEKDITLWLIKSWNFVAKWYQTPVLKLVCTPPQLPHPCNVHYCIKRRVPPAGALNDGIGPKFYNAKGIGQYTHINAWDEKLCSREQKRVEGSKVLRLIEKIKSRRQIWNLQWKRLKYDYNNWKCYVKWEILSIRLSFSNVGSL